MRVNESGEKRKKKYVNIETCMPVFTDDIAAIGDRDPMQKSNKKLQKNGNREKNTIWTEKDKI